MRPKRKRADMPIDLVMAVGLVWGHLRARQFEEAYLLAKGCLRVWPDDRSLILMQSYAAAEVLEPVDVDKLLAIKDAASEEWVHLVLRRSVAQSASAPSEHENAQVPATAPKGKAAAIAQPADRSPTLPQALVHETVTNQESTQ